MKKLIYIFLNSINQALISYVNETYPFCLNFNFKLSRFFLYKINVLSMLLIKLYFKPTL